MRICILGDSLSSLTLAKSLVNQKIHVDLIKQKSKLNFFKSRTIGISNSNIEYFNKNIANIKKIQWKIKKIEIFTDNTKSGKLINFENKKKQLFSIVKFNDLYQILKKDLFKNKYFKEKLTRNKSLSFIKNYDLIINSDYSHILNKKYFSKKIVKSYNSLAYTTIINHKKILNNVATQIFTKRGPLAFLPVSNYETSIVYSVHDSYRNKKENIGDLIKAKNFKYKIIKIKKIDNFELKSSHLRSYYHNNILAFGDILHRIHPLAGQGFNMTIRDIRSLNNIIKDKLTLGLPLDSSVNKVFENNFKHKNFIFSNGIDLIHEFFNLERKIKSNIMGKSIQILGKNKSINKVLSKIADEGILF